TLVRPPSSPLFPYTTLFRSVGLGADRLGGADGGSGLVGQAPGRMVRGRLPHPRPVGPHSRGDPQPRLQAPPGQRAPAASGEPPQDRKSTRLNSSHVKISYAV